jgi:hypothetical protein
MATAAPASPPERTADAETRQRLENLEQGYRTEISDGISQTDLVNLYFFRGVVHNESQYLDLFFHLLGDNPFPVELKRFVSTQTAELLAASQRAVRQRSLANVSITGFEITCTASIDGKIISNSLKVLSGARHLAHVRCPGATYWLELEVPAGAAELAIHRAEFNQKSLGKAGPSLEQSVSLFRFRTGGLGHLFMSLNGPAALTSPSWLVPGPLLGFEADTTAVSVATGPARLAATKPRRRPATESRGYWLDAELTRNLWQSSSGRASLWSGGGILLLATTQRLQAIYPILGVGPQATVVRFHSGWTASLKLNTELLPTVNDSYLGFALSLTLAREPTPRPIVHPIKG